MFNIYVYILTFILTILDKLSNVKTECIYQLFILFKV